MLNGIKFLYSWKSYLEESLQFPMACFWDPFKNRNRSQYKCVFVLREEMVGWEGKREREREEIHYVVPMLAFWTIENRVLQKWTSLGRLFKATSINPEQTGSWEACSGSLMWSNRLSRTRERNPGGVELTLLGYCRRNHSKWWNTSGLCGSKRQDSIYLIVSAGRVEGISSADKQSIIVFL